jgi:hypothetical protein
MTDSTASGGDSAAGIEGSCLRANTALGAQRIDCTRKRWSPAAEARFLDELAASANAARAAREAGFSDTAVYARRRKYPDFAEKWRVARQQGVARIELALVEAAEASLTLDEAEYGADRPIPRMTVAEALAVVKMLGEEGDRTRQGRRAANWLPLDPDKARENILAKVRMVRRARERRGA